MTAAFLTDFWVLDAPMASEWMWLEWSSRSQGLTPNLTDHVFNESSRPLPAGRFVDPSGPVAFKQMRPGRRPDLIGTDSLVPVVTGRLIRLFAQEGFTGIHPWPVVVFDKADRRVVDDDVFWARVAPGCAAMDPKRGAALCGGHYSEDHTQWLTPEQMESAYGWYIPVASWTGNDIFRRPRGSQLIVTQRVFDAMQRAHITNIEFTPILDVGKDAAHGWAAAARRKLQK